MNYLPSPQILFLNVLVAVNFFWYTAMYFLMKSLSMENMEKHGNLFMSTNGIYSKNFNCLSSVCYKNDFKGFKFNYYQLEINV